MKLADIRHIMQQYGRAWERQDSDLLLTCFTKNAIYQESPLAKPYRGHKAIKKFWDNVVKKEMYDITFTLKNIYLSHDKKVGFAEWGCKNKRKRIQYHMAGIMLLTMQGNKIAYLHEYWNTRKIIL